MIKDKGNKQNFEQSVWAQKWTVFYWNASTKVKKYMKYNNKVLEQAWTKNLYFLFRYNETDVQFDRNIGNNIKIRHTKVLNSHIKQKQLLMGKAQILNSYPFQEVEEVRECNISHLEGNEWTFD